MVNCKKRKNMTGTVDNAVEEIKNFFHTLQTSENWFRFGVTFSTQEKYYFLDTGTGKIFRVNQQVYRVLECILKTNNFENLSYLGMAEEELLLALKEIEKAVKEEHILQAPRVTGMVYYKEDIENSLDHAMQAVTLEITERCNLRCDYCIYNENDSDFRQFGSTDISPDTIKTALDFFFARCGKEFNVGFYGGEPLIRFDLIKIAVEYAEKLVDGTNKELHFFFATESPDENAISLQDAVEQLTEEYRDRLEEIEAGTEYNRQEIQSNDGSYAIAWQNVLAVFASQTAGDANGAAVAYLDEDNVERLRTVLWDMNELYWRTESQTREVEQTNEDDESETTTITETVLIIELIHHTPEEMRDAYHFTNRQNEYLTLLSGDETSILWGGTVGWVCAGERRNHGSRYGYSICGRRSAMAIADCWNDHFSAGIPHRPRYRRDQLPQRYRHSSAGRYTNFGRCRWYSNHRQRHRQLGWQLRVLCQDRPWWRAYNLVFPLLQYLCYSGPAGAGGASRCLCWPDRKSDRASSAF